MFRKQLSIVLALSSLTSAPAAFASMAGDCRAADQPAATLLIPYFEVDLDDPTGITTVISVNNGAPRPVVARATLWTDWGVPTLAFDIYLTGYDAQTLNVRELLRGELPVTGADVSNNGPLSKPAEVFPGCSGAVLAQSAWARPRSAFKASERNQLRAAHTGKAIPGTRPARCAGSGQAGASVATGYITIDAVNRCTPMSIMTRVNTPAGEGYFAAGGTGIASNSNVLFGDALYVIPRTSSAESQSAVHVVADADAFSAGHYTFYGRYVGFDGRDGRAPLSSLYYSRYTQGSPLIGTTEMIVWRDTREAVPEGAECGKTPRWSPMGEMQLVAFDDEENPSVVARSNAFPTAAQRVKVGSTALPISETSGWMMVDLWHANEEHAQGWVSTVTTANGRLITGHQAVRADDLCNFGL
ncbi:MAG TPA: hypothetical protein VMW27_22015 [Thermoanaerobaculia bacterium]|nr:hypothetical protein [Thermoanaerobaculia bacterium]